MFAQTAPADLTRFETRVTIQDAAISTNSLDSLGYLLSHILVAAHRYGDWQICVNEQEIYFRLRQGQLTCIDKPEPTDSVRIDLSQEPFFGIFYSRRKYI